MGSGSDRLDIKAERFADAKKLGLPGKFNISAMAYI
jgi:hypothetical protein